MEPADRLEALELIHESQTNTASATVQIGGVRNTSGIVEHDSLYVQDAPAAVLNDLRDAGFRLSVGPVGVCVEK